MWNHEGDFRYAVVVRKCNNKAIQCDLSETGLNDERVNCSQASRISLTGFPGIGSNRGARQLAHMVSS